MESVVEGLLYVQGDLGITLKDIERILGIDEEEAKRIVLSLKNYYDDNKRGLRINFLGNTINLRLEKNIRSIIRSCLKNRLRIVYHSQL